MLVYRVSSKKEIDKLFQNRDIKDIGNYCTKTDANNHEYEENSKYHFNRSNAADVCPLYPSFGGREQNRSAD